jgi:hypothetical protein
LKGTKFRESTLKIQIEMTAEPFDLGDETGTRLVVALGEAVEGNETGTRLVFAPREYRSDHDDVRVNEFR